MNDRLRKIAIETDAWCDQYYFGDKFYDIEWEKKFAELIVQECVTKCDEVQAMYGQYTFTARKCKEAITGHFGVDK